jgi:hypothetical protein
MNIKVLVAVSIVAMSALGFSTTASAEEHHGWVRPYVGHTLNPWPFVAGAVVGGIIVHEYNTPPVIVNTQPDPPVLVNGVMMQRTYRCVQQIVTDRFGNESVVNHCNYVYVPVQTVPAQ